MLALAMLNAYLLCFPSLTTLKTQATKQPKKKRRQLTKRLHSYITSFCYFSLFFARIVGLKQETNVTKYKVELL